jgi:hypothetical protein
MGRPPVSPSSIDSRLARNPVQRSFRLPEEHAADAALLKLCVSVETAKNQRLDLIVEVAGLTSTARFRFRLLGVGRSLCAPSNRAIERHVPTSEIVGYSNSAANSRYPRISDWPFVAS